MRKTITVFVLTFLASFSYAQNILSRLEGNWSANGTAFGMPAVVTMSWTPALLGKYHQLNYKMVMTTKDGKQSVFEGTALYKPSGDNAFVATWCDSQSEMHPITATSDAEALTSLWGTPETKQGKTIYRFVAGGQVEVTDFIMKKDGTWAKFNQNTLAKV